MARLPKAKRPARPDRRQAIAETAIAVLARDGARGLTHRAVDDEAGLARGSTSFYFRTRGGLLEAAASRLVELDGEDIAHAAASRDVSRLLERWTSPGYRQRLIARFELFLEAARSPKVKALLQGPRRTFLRATQAAFENAGAADAELRAQLLVAAIDGVLIGTLMGPRRSPATLRQVLRRIFATGAGA